jgi:MFS family permease
MMTQRPQKVLTRDFILSFCAYFTVSFALNILIPTLPIYLSRSGVNEIEIGVLIGSFAVSSLVLRPFVGKALLRISENTFMIAGTLLWTVTSLAYLAVSPFWPLMLVRVCQGAGFAFFQTASFTLIARTSSEAHRGQTLSYFNLAINVSGALAPLLGMFLINYFSFTLLFLVCSGLSLCSLFITRKLEKRQVTPLQASHREGVFLFSRKALPPAIINFFSSSSWGALTAFFPLYAIEHGVANPGLFFTTIAMMLILGRSLGGKVLDVYSKERIILPCITTYIISMVILAFSKTQPMFILAAAVWGIGHAFLVPALMVYALEGAGSSPGPAMGTYTATMDLGICLGPVLMGIVLQLTNYSIMFLSLALFALISLNYFYFAVWKKG